MAAVSFSSSRFGTVEVEEDAVLTFPQGLIGLGGNRFALVGEAGEPILWLHSLDDPDLALPVAEPWAFFPDYALDVADDDAERLGISEPDQARVLVVVRVGATAQECYANLKAPILVVDGTGHQVLNEADAPLRAPLLPEA